VILLDLMMPVMDGWTFRQEILKDQALAAIPVVVMTAASPAQAKSVVSATVLYKPLQMDTVVELLQVHCPGGAA
jgi:CheY-like chemotaxis protein